MASVLVLLETFIRKGAAVLGFFPCATAPPVLFASAENESPLRVEKRKQHILALQLAWILIFFRRKQNSRANFPDFPLRFGNGINYNKHKASKYTAGNRYCAGKRREETQ